MKIIQNLYLLAACVLTLQASAQITLTQNDFPAAGTSIKVFYAQSDSLLNINDSVTIGVAGANGTYDFSKLLPLAIDSNTINYVTAASTGWASNHPTASFAALTEVEVDSATGDTIAWDYPFFRSSPDVLEQVGITIILDTAGIFSGVPSGNLDTVHATSLPIDTIVDVAYALNYMNTDSSRWLISIFPLAFTQITTQNIEVDGWGDLTNPWGIFSVLRVKVTTIDSGLATILGFPVDSEKDTSHTFEYWAAGIGHPLVVVETDSSFTNVYWIEFVETTPIIGIGNNRKERSGLFPNPARGNITFDPNYSKGRATKYSVYNILGSKIMESNIDPNTEKQVINVVHLDKGVYILMLQMENGKIVMTNKFVVE